MMDRVPYTGVVGHGRHAGGHEGGTRLRATGMVVFATVDDPRHRVPVVVEEPDAPPSVWRARAARGVAWLLGR